MRLRRGCLIPCGAVIVMLLCCCGTVSGYFAYIAIDIRRIPVESTAFTLRYADMQRDYRLYVPDSLPEGENVPLVMVLHGGGGTPINMERLTRGRFNALADEYGFMVVYPAGIEKHWNDGRDADVSRSLRENIDDVGFLEALIDSLTDDYPVDRTRVYATGISNGGLMSYRLACDSEAFAAVAPVAANLAQGMIEKCEHLRPIPMLVINGDDDPLIRVEGGTILLNRGTTLTEAESIAFWRENNGCDENPITDYLPDSEDDKTRVRREFYTGCASPLILYEIEGGGHTWAGGYQYLPVFVVGHTSRDINAADEIWSFFASLEN